MKEKSLKLITKILAILVLCLVSFVGIYKVDDKKIQNQVKGYDFTNYRQLIFELSDAVEVVDQNDELVGTTDDYTDSSIETNQYKKTEKKVNSEESLNAQNYKKAKSVIEKRLQDFQIKEYNIGLDEDNGRIYLQIPEDAKTDHVISNILQISNFEIRDSKDKEKVFLKNEDLEKVSAFYNTLESGTTVYLEVKLNKNGTKILKDLSTGEYAKKPEESKEEGEETDQESNEEANNEESNENKSEENESEENKVEEDKAEGEETSEEESNKEEEDSQKEIVLAIDNNNLITSSFPEPKKDGKIYLTMGAETKDDDVITESLQSAATMATLLNSDRMPLTYKITENYYIESNSLKDNIKYIVYAVAGITLLAMIYLIIKFKLKGLISAISYIGFVALFLLLIRYVNITIAIESIVAIVITLAINYVLTYQLTKIEENNSKLYYEKIISSIIKLIPVLIISVIFTFSAWTAIATFGMAMFWGVLLSVIYNTIVTKNMVNLK